MSEQRDPKLWQLAKRRAAFQSSLIQYSLITVLCWVIWYITAARNGINTHTPWPLWVMFGLGIDLVIKFLKAYKTDNEKLTEQEYEKLKNRQ